MRWSPQTPPMTQSPQHFHDEEPESCGSAANFLLGKEMEGDLTGRMEVEAGAHPLKINDSNKCHLFLSIASPPAVNHDQADDILPAAEAKKVKKMPKTKNTDRKQGRGNAHDRPVPNNATTTFAHSHVPSLMRNQPVKYMTKAQLSKSLVASEVRFVPLFFNL